MTTARMDSLERRRLLATSPITFGGDLNDGIYAVESLPDGGQIVAGTFGTTTDFQPGSGVTTLTSRGQSDLFAARYSRRGKLIWVSQMGGDFGRIDEEPPFASPIATVGELFNGVGPAVDQQGEYLTSVAVTGSQVVLAGAFQEIADFDPSPTATFELNGGEYRDAFLARLNLADGTFAGAIGFGGRFDDAIKDIVMADNGDAIVTGLYTRDADFNPGSGVTFREAIGRDDIFVARYTLAGALSWLYTAGGDAVDEIDRDSGEGIALDANGNIYVTGSFAGEEADFDPSPSELLIGAIDRSDGFLLRLSPRGKLDYVKSFGGEETDGGKNIAVDQTAGRLYMSGYFGDVADLDPGAAVSSLLAREDGDSRDNDNDDEGEDSFDAFIGQYSLRGEAQWVRQIGGDDWELLGQMRVSPADGGVVLSGSFAGRIEFYGARSASTVMSVEGDDDFEDDSRRGSSYDAFVVRYSTSGGFVARQTIGGSGDDWGNAIDVGLDNATTTFAGIFRNTVTFAFEDVNRRVTANKLQDAFFINLSLADDLL